MNIFIPLITVAGAALAAAFGAALVIVLKVVKENLQTPERLQEPGLIDGMAVAILSAAAGGGLGAAVGMLVQKALS